MTLKAQQRHPIAFLVLLLVGAVYFFPMASMLLASIKPSNEIFDTRSIIPTAIRFENYVDAVTEIPFLTYLKNTVLIATGCVLGIVFSVTLTGYGFSRIPWRGRDVVFYIVLSSMMIPFFVTVIPLFTLYVRIGLTNTLWPLIIPAWFGNPFYIYIMREFFKTIPMSFSESAYMDGASEWQVFSRICVPLVRLPIIVCALLEIMFIWQDFLRPVIFLNSQSKYTLSIGLQQFFSLRGALWGPMMAAAALVTLPLVILYFTSQRYFISGITMTGLKG